MSEPLSPVDRDDWDESSFGGVAAVPASSKPASAVRPSIFRCRRPACLVTLVPNASAVSPCVGRQEEIRLSFSSRTSSQTWEKRASAAC